MLPSSEEFDVAAVARGGLLEFFKRAWAVVRPQDKLSVGWHHGLMCKAFEALLREEPEAEKGVCNVPPGSSKSLLTSVFLPAFAWGPGKRPDWRVGYGSFDVNLSFRDSSLCKDLIRSEWYQRRWGFKADPEMLKRYGLVPVTAGQENSALTDSASIWYTSGGGLRFATSTGSKATGWHFHAFFVDDPTKPDTIKGGGDQARDALKRTQEWWTQTISSRRVNPNYFGRWVIMQRLHTEDLAAYAIKEGYTAIVVPARHELARPCTTPWGDDPRTEEGEIFWPERFADKGLSDLERSLGQHARAQYQQDPIPDGGSIFRPAWLSNLYRVLPAGMDAWLSSWDCTFSGKGNADYVVGQVWARKGADYYLVEQVRFRGGLPETVAAIKRIRERFPKAIRTLIEAKANGPAVMQVLEGKLSGLVAVEPEGGKVARAHEASVYFEAMNVHLPEGAEWLQDYISEFLAFPQGAHDDCVDATTQALNLFNPSHADKLDRLHAALRSRS